MSVRVHELAKEFGIPSKELLGHLKTLKVPAKNHMSALDDETAEILRHELAGRFKKGKSAPAHTASAPRGRAAKAVAPERAAEVTPAPSVAAAVAVAPEPEAPPPPPKRLLEVQLPITVKDLAAKLGETPSEVIKRLLGLGVLATINQSVDEKVVAQVAEAFGCELAKVASAEEALRERFQVAPSAHLAPRAPVVTLMGHVDHGKTSLLDAIRQTNVTATEAGGITQHIGAYEVVLPKGRVTFLDTPGHAAFTAMRARGANVTDVVVLVVAADDGVMPQTVEAVDHAKAAGVPIVVAINKMDKPEANADRVKQELMEHGLVAEEWGGKTIMVGVSAKTKQGIDQLLEMLLLESELLELKADPTQPARGTVLEGKLSKGSGPLAHVLIQNGTLRVGDLIIAGAAYGRVRALINDHGQRVRETEPGQPVEVLGLQGVPEAGDTFHVMDDERLAREIVEKRQAERRTQAVIRAPRISLEGLHQKIAEGAIKELKLVLKADVQGSLEAIQANLAKLASEEVKLVPIHIGVGDINESDIMLAAASEAIVMGFHVGVDLKAQEQAIREGVELRTYNIIYELTDEVRRALEGLLTPQKKEILLGTFQVKQVFKVSKVGLVAGGIVLKGKVVRAGASARLRRGNEVLHTSKLASLKRFKDDVREVAEGTECGLSLEGFTDYQPGDIVEVYQIEEIARKL